VLENATLYVMQFRAAFSQVLGIERYRSRRALTIRNNMTSLIVGKVYGIA
jgi:hypothetical protein